MTTNTSTPPDVAPERPAAQFVGSVTRERVDFAVNGDTTFGRIGAEPAGSRSRT